MSFISAATAMGLTGIGATIGAGVMMGGATTIGMNLIRGNDPFDNIGQGLLLGGISGGIFGGAGAAAGVGEGAAASASFDAAGNMIPIKDMATTAFSDNAAANLGSKYGGTNMLPGMQVSDPYGLNSVANNYNLAPHSIYGGSSNLAVPTPDVYLNDPQFLGDPEAAMQARQLGAMKQTQGLISMPPAPEAVAPAAVAPPVGTTDMPVIQPNAVGGYPKSSSDTSFMDDPFKWMNANKGKTALGAAVAAGAMGAFNPKTGLNNLPPRTYQRVNTSYNPGTVNPKYGMPGEPYFVGQGYGPQTRETFSVAAGGGIRALNGGGETAPYVPMTARGQMTNKEDVPTDLDDSAAFKRYLKSDINKKEEKGQAEIDANVMAWLKKYSENTQHAAMGGPIDGRTYQQGGNRFAEGGGLNQPQQVTQFQPTYSPSQQGIGSLQPYQAPNVPAMESSPEPQYQMNGFSDNSLFQPTGSGGMTNYQPQQQQAQTYQQPNMTMPPGIAEYIANMNNIKPPNTNVPRTPPVTATTPAVTNTTSPTIYNPAIQTYGADPAATTAATTAGTDPNDTGSWGLLSGSGEDAHWGYTGPGGATNGQWVGQSFDDNGGRTPGVWTPDGSTNDSSAVTNTATEIPLGPFSAGFPFTNTTSPTIYDPATQTYSANPNIPAPTPAPAASVDDGASYSDAQGGDYPGQYGGGAGDNSEKAGGPIASKRYAMGGLAALPEYAAGGKLLSGDGDGMSDSIPAVIKGARPQRAALADGEFVIPADVVSHLGNGSTKAGGKRLYEMMANIRKARTGNSKQGKQINPMKFIPA